MVSFYDRLLRAQRLKHVNFTMEGRPNDIRWMTFRTLQDKTHLRLLIQTYKVMRNTEGSADEHAKQMRRLNRMLGAK